MNKDMNNEKTKVLFRIYPENDVIAIFPDELGGMSPTTCQSYQHVGQHGACDPHLVVSMTLPATPYEYAPLKEELERIGYNLEITHRLPLSSRSNRWMKAYGNEILNAPLTT